ncbi:hypothetical protein DL93DRAFT_2170404 [Clavulina sp. PMI_390]|nr:hypothetical protein DL93DRAFT_2170404 [Clavulina sp. PMI_390]
MLTERADNYRQTASNTRLTVSGGSKPTTKTTASSFKSLDNYKVTKAHTTHIQKLQASAPQEIVTIRALVEQINEDGNPNRRTANLGYSQKVFKMSERALASLQMVLDETLRWWPDKPAQVEIGDVSLKITPTKQIHLITDIHRSYDANKTVQDFVNDLVKDNLIKAEPKASYTITLSFVIPENHPRQHSRSDGDTISLDDTDNDDVVEVKTTTKVVKKEPVAKKIPIHSLSSFRPLGTSCLQTAFNFLGDTQLWDIKTLRAEVDEDGHPVLKEDPEPSMFRISTFLAQNKHLAIAGEEVPEFCCG